MEELYETEAVELPDGGEDRTEATARPLPATFDSASEVSTWRGGVGSAALAAAGGLVAGAATVAAVRATRGSAGRRPQRRIARAKERPMKVVASRSFMVDVHLLGDK